MKKVNYYLLTLTSVLFLLVLSFSKYSNSYKNRQIEWCIKEINIGNGIAWEQSESWLRQDISENHKLLLINSREKYRLKNSIIYRKPYDMSCSYTEDKTLFFKVINFIFPKYKEAIFKPCGFGNEIRGI